jgi:hypothetical protein
VTSQPQPAPGSASQYLRPLRDIAVYALVAAPAAMLLVAIIRLIPSGVGLDFGSRAQDSFYSYVNVPTIFFPLGAVLLALLVRPLHPKAKLITIIAVIEYAVAAVFAIVFGILVGLIEIASSSVRTAFEELLARAAWLAVFAVAAFAAYQIWRHLFYTPKPKREPGVYGQPQYGVPGTYPGQPAYGPPGQAGVAQPGYGAPAGQPPYGPAGQPPYGPAGQPPYGPAGQPPYGPAGQPPYGPAGQAPYGPAGQPQYGAPDAYPGQPAPATTQPFTAQPSTYTASPGEQSYSAFTEPTQVVPQAGAEGAEPDRTQIVGDDRPGYGPAEEDPPRR